MSDWQPIESAPRDGTMLMLWEGVDAWRPLGHRFGHWKEDTRYLKGGYWSDGGALAIIATHWMPLPAPPETTGGTR